MKEIQTHLSKGSLSSANLSPAQWSALAFVLLTSEEELEEFELQKFKKSDECLIRLLAVIKTSKRALLNDCGLTDKSCSALATVLGSDTNLKELNMINNNLQDSGVKLLCTGLKNTKCHLEILRLSNCSITEEGYKALASALRSNPSHLIELDLTGNDPGQSGVKELNDLLQDPDCQLKTLRFLGPAADEACQFVTGVVGKNPLFLGELKLSGRELGDTRVNQIAALLQDKHCQLNTLILHWCRITEEQCCILNSALKSNPSHLRELDLSMNELGDSGVKNLSDLLMNPQCKLEKLNLRYCSITEKQCVILTSALKSNPSHLRELDLSGNELGDSGFKNLSDLLMNPQCKLEKLHLYECSVKEKQCLILTSALKSNPSHLRDLNLRLNELGDSGFEILSDLLMNPQCKLEKLNLLGCSITEKQCLILTSALKSNPSHLRELNLGGNKIQNTGVNHLSDVLKDSHCKLERLWLISCEITDEGCSALTSALKSNPSHLRELDLSMNELGDSGVKNLSDLLMNPQFKLEKLTLYKCSITEKQCVILTSALKSNPSHLRELDLSRNKLGDSGVKNLSDLLMNPQCKLEKLNLWECSITEKQCLILTSALKSNPSHLRELELSMNQIKNIGVNHLCDVLKDPHCKLERLSLNECGITDVSSLTQSLTNTKALQFLKDLDLRCNMIEDSKQQLIDLLQDSNCKLSVGGKPLTRVPDRLQSPKDDKCCIS
ncbi:ribonuclease inhibitor-like [Garra rufa]|uniref:ribonuclease inhibitor-like n=1 Tax=Garra rufa TaxID=137080 RepID=UPI003CCEAF6C